MFCLTTPALSPTVRETKKYLSVKSAANFSGYSPQYLRRLLREGRLKAIKIGQVWLIELASLEVYLSRASNIHDRRFGPRSQLIANVNG